MFSPLFPVFVALKEERGGKKSQQLTLFFFFFASCHSVCVKVSKRNIFSSIFAFAAQPRAFCLPGGTCCLSSMGEPTSRAETESFSTARLMHCLFFNQKKEKNLLLGLEHRSQGSRQRRRLISGVLPCLPSLCVGHHLLRLGSAELAWGCPSRLSLAGGKGLGQRLCFCSVSGGGGRFPFDPACTAFLGNWRKIPPHSEDLWWL